MSDLRGDKIKKSVRFSEPLVEKCYSLPPGEDRISTWVSDAQHFKRRVEHTEQLLLPVLISKIQKKKITFSRK